MNAEKYVVKCLRCGGGSKICIINETIVQYIDQSPIISCRLRGDLKWGFQCECGNDNRLARQEEKDIKILVNTKSTMALEQIAKTLKIKDETQFRMEQA